MNCVKNKEYKEDVILKLYQFLIIQKIALIIQPLK